MLTPLDIHNKDFKRGFRGYSETEVDEFLDEVVRDFEALLKENAALKAQADELRQKVEQYRQMEETLKNALVVAQEAASEVKANARKEADLIVREAQADAERRRRLADEAVARAGQKLAEVERHATEFRARVRSLLEGQIEVLKRDDAWRVDTDFLRSLGNPEDTRVAPAAGLPGASYGREEAAAGSDAARAGAAGAAGASAGAVSASADVAGASADAAGTSADAASASADAAGASAKAANGGTSGNARNDHADRPRTNGEDGGRRPDDGDGKRRAQGSGRSG